MELLFAFGAIVVVVAGGWLSERRFANERTEWREERAQLVNRILATNPDTNPRVVHELDTSTEPRTPREQPDPSLTPRPHGT